MDIWNEPISTEGCLPTWASFTIKALHDDYIGAMRAVRPTTGKLVWGSQNNAPLWGGVLTDQRVAWCSGARQRVLKGC